MRYESVGRGFESLPSHQEKPVHIVCWFFFFVCAMEGARTGRRRIAPQAISPVGCCLARGFQRVGMSTVEAVNRKISWLFCFSGRVCTLLHISCTLYKKAMLPYAIFCPSFFFFFNSFPEILTHKDGFRGSLFFGKNDLHSSVECGWEPRIRGLRIAKQGVSLFMGCALFIYACFFCDSANIRASSVPDSCIPRFIHSCTQP